MKLDKNSIKGTICVLVSAISFSLGGILIKMIPWSSITIQSTRSIFSFVVIAAYMMMTGHLFVCNKSVLLGAGCNLIMSFTFVAATKMTTAANAIVLQFTEPIFVILLLWIVFKNKPGKDAIITCILVFSGILCFFFESLSAGGMLGNILAVISGLSYAGVFLIKRFPEGDFESALLISNAISAVVGIPFFLAETEFSAEIWMYMIVLGVVQYGLSYIFLSKGLDHVSPVTASLTSTIEPILNPILVAAFYGETIGHLAVIGAILVIGTATVYNVKQATQKSKTE